ncbi:MAG: hypothetical protein ACK4RG_07940 [Fimbriimonadales bacterium]
MTNRARLWLLMLVALLNSGGMGYWVCHDQIRSGSFWLKVCSEDVSTPWSNTLALPPNDYPTLDVRACDCHFVAVDAPLPHQLSMTLGFVWSDAPVLLPPATDLAVQAVVIVSPTSHAPPQNNSHTKAPTLRAPPAG